MIHHSDQGVQYAAHDYINELKQHQFQISMSRKGNPYDNAAAESFMKTLKAEEVYLWEYRTFDDVLRRIPYFIDEVYNQKRLHSSLGYRPPNEFETILEGISGYGCLQKIDRRAFVREFFCPKGQKPLEPSILRDSHDGYNFHDR